jgi:hypothetical protein
VATPCPQIPICAVRWARRTTHGQKHWEAAETKSPATLGLGLEARLLRSKRERAPTRPVLGMSMPNRSGCRRVHRRTPRERASEGTVRSGQVRSVRAARSMSGVEPVPFRVSRGASSSSLAGARRGLPVGPRRSVAACCGSVGWLVGRNEGFRARWPRRHRICPDRQSRVPAAGSIRLGGVRAWKTKKRYPQRHNDDAFDGMGWDGMGSVLVEKYSLDDRPPATSRSSSSSGRPGPPTEGGREGCFAIGHRLGQCAPTCERTFPAMMIAANVPVARAHCRPPVQFQLSLLPSPPASRAHMSESPIGQVQPLPFDRTVQRTADFVGWGPSIRCCALFVGVGVGVAVVGVVMVVVNCEAGKQHAERGIAPKLDGPFG